LKTLKIYPNDFGVTETNSIISVTPTQNSSNFSNSINFNNNINKKNIIINKEQSTKNEFLVDNQPLIVPSKSSDQTLDLQKEIKSENLNEEIINQNSLEQNQLTQQQLTLFVWPSNLQEKVTKLIDSYNWNILLIYKFIKKYKQLPSTNTKRSPDNWGSKPGFCEIAIPTEIVQSFLNFYSKNSHLIEPDKKEVSTDS
jgi:hypothetical protein